MIGYGAILTTLRRCFLWPDVELEIAMRDNRRSRSTLERCVEDGFRAADEMLSTLPVHAGERPFEHSTNSSRT